MEKSGFKFTINLKKIFIVAAAFVVLILCIRLYHYFFSTTGVSKIGGLINTVGYEQGDRADFHTSDKGLFFATKDGVIFFNNDASSILWQDSYTMMNPVMRGSGNAAGVAESGGNTLAVYSTEGNLYKIQSEGKIVTFAVNDKGGSALISQTDNEYTITAYTESGFTAFMAKNPISDGMPVACDISDNGRLLAVSYIYTGYTEIESRVVFYNLVKNTENDADIDADEEMVASFIRDSQVLGILNFMNNNTFVALSSSELVCVRLSFDGDVVSCTELWSAPLENSVDGFAPLGDKYVAVVLGEKNLNSYESEEPNTLVIYDMRGKAVSKTTVEKAADGLYDGGNSSVIVKMGRTFRVYDKKGSAVLSYTVSQDVNKLLLYGKKALIVTPKEAYIMSVKSKGLGTLISRIRKEDSGGIGNESEDNTDAPEDNTQEPSQAPPADDKKQEVSTENKADSENSGTEDKTDAENAKAEDKADVKDKKTEDKADVKDKAAEDKADVKDKKTEDKDDKQEEKTEKQTEKTENDRQGNDSVPEKESGNSEAREE